MCTSGGADGYISSSGAEAESGGGYSPCLGLELLGAHPLATAIGTLQIYKKVGFFLNRFRGRGGMMIEWLYMIDSVYYLQKFTSSSKSKSAFFFRWTSLENRFCVLRPCTLTERQNMPEFLHLSLTGWYVPSSETRGITHKQEWQPHNTSSLIWNPNPRRMWVHWLLSLTFRTWWLGWVRKTLHRAMAYPQLAWFRHCHGKKATAGQEWSGDGSEMIRVKVVPRGFNFNLIQRYLLFR